MQLVFYAGALLSDIFFFSEMSHLRSPNNFQFYLIKVCNSHLETCSLAYRVDYG